MAIPKGHKKNLETLLKAGADGNVCLMECTNKITGSPVIVVCALWTDEDGLYNFVPMAKMFDGNPYDEVNPPMENPNE